MVKRWIPSGKYAILLDEVDGVLYFMDPDDKNIPAAALDTMLLRALRSERAISSARLPVTSPLRAGLRRLARRGGITLHGDVWTWGA